MGGGREQVDGGRARDRNVAAAPSRTDRQRSDAEGRIVNAVVDGRGQVEGARHRDGVGRGDADAAIGIHGGAAAAGGADAGSRVGAARAGADDVDRHCPADAVTALRERDGGRQRLQAHRMPGGDGHAAARFEVGAIERLRLGFDIDDVERHRAGDRDVTALVAADRESGGDEIVAVAARSDGLDRDAAAGERRAAVHEGLVGHGNEIERNRCRHIGRSVVVEVDGHAVGLRLAVDTGTRADADHAAGIQVGTVGHLDRVGEVDDADRDRR